MSLLASVSRSIICTWEISNIDLDFSITVWFATTYKDYSILRLSFMSFILAEIVEWIDISMNIHLIKIQDDLRIQKLKILIDT